MRSVLKWILPAMLMSWILPASAAVTLEVVTSATPKSKAAAAVAADGDAVSDKSKWRAILTADADGTARLVLRNADGKVLHESAKLALKKGAPLNYPDGAWNDFASTGLVQFAVEFDPEGAGANEEAKLKLRVASFGAPAMKEVKGGAAGSRTERSRGGASLPSAGDLAAPAPVGELFKAGQAEKMRGGGDVQRFKKYSPGVVLIYTPLEKGAAQGSGALIDRKNGLIVTNQHVVDGGKQFFVAFKPKEDVELTNSHLMFADLLKVDEESDLALLKVQYVPEHAVELKLGEFDEIEIGQDVFAIGNPGAGQNWTYTKGIVSQVKKDHVWQYSGEDFPRKASVVQTQTPISSGNSGGPLLDAEGRIVGINSVGTSGQNINLAVSTVDIREMLDRQGNMLVERAAAQKPTQVAAAPAQPAQECQVKVLVSEDQDKNGQDDLWSVDADCDGKQDAIVEDSNGDGKYDIIYVDRNGDGKPDLVKMDQNGDGEFEIEAVDENYDGKLDVAHIDTDGDGEADRIKRL